MNSRHSRSPTRVGERPHSPRSAGDDRADRPVRPAPIHAPNAALLIDFDNVTMGIRSDLGKELRSLLSSDIIKGKVAVQRAYADWRRYPQYIVPLAESSIDLIFAPAYGSSKKNATDIRLAIDAHRARLHASRDRHLHPALRRLRLLEPRHQAQGVRQVRHRRRHPRIVERPARPELRRVLQLQRARRPRESAATTSPRASAIRGSS